MEHRRACLDASERRLRGEMGFLLEGDEERRQLLEETVETL